MNITIADLEKWITSPSENEHLEFKEAKSSYSASKICEYAVALGNEGGGHLVLGVTDKLPRKIVGTGAFPNPSGIVDEVYKTLRRRIHVHELAHPQGRILVFEMPAAPPGQPLEYNGRYLMRAGESLVSMTPEQLSRIVRQAQSDYSANIIDGASLHDLDPDAIEDFRRRWNRRSGLERLLLASDQQLLEDAGLLRNGGVTVAALALFGKESSLTRLMPQTEIIFEFRSEMASGPAQQRVNFRQGFFCCNQELWNLINLRNDRQSYQEGFFRYSIPTFEEIPVREAILNAVAHRDYQSQGSIFVRQFPRKLVIESPGGFPAGITPQNVIDKQYPKNRCIAEALEKCGLVERSGQGMNLIYESAIRNSKHCPDFSGTDDYQVVITLFGEVADPAFVRFLELVNAEQQVNFDTADLLLMDYVRRDEPIPDSIKAHVNRLVELGILERAGKRLLLSHRLYSYMGNPATHTVRRGLDKETNKSLLLTHIVKNRNVGSPLSDLVQVLPSAKEHEVKRLLQELKTEGKIHPRGQKRWAKWFPDKDPAKEQ